jgi:FtsZ-binding cell division protein ZapB
VASCSTNPKQKIKRHEIVLAEVHELRSKNVSLLTKVTDLEKTIGALKRENLRLSVRSSSGDKSVIRDRDASALERSAIKSARRPTNLKDAQRVRVDKENNNDLNGSVMSTTVTTSKAPSTVTRRTLRPAGAAQRTADAPAALNLTAQLAARYGNDDAAVQHADVSLMLDIEENDDNEEDPFAPIGAKVATVEFHDMTGDLANLSVIAPKADHHLLQCEDEDDIDPVLLDAY